MSTNNSSSAAVSENSIMSSNHESQKGPSSAGNGQPTAPSLPENDPATEGKTPADTHDVVHYGSRVSMKEVLAVSEEAIVKPEVDMLFIQSAAHSPETLKESDVCDYQSVQFNAENSELIEKCRRLSQHVSEDLAGIRRHINELSRILDGTDRYQDSIQENAPWTRFAKVQVLLLALFSVVLLLVGINTIAQVLISSGIPGFENPWRAYLFSATPVGVAFGIKTLRGFINGSRHKTAYTVTVWICGMFFGILWIVLFASTFPGLTQSTADIINSLADNPGEPDSGGSGVLFVFVSIFAESLIAGACWLSIETTVEKHQPSIRRDNPPFLKSQADLDLYLSQKAELEDIAGKLDGKMGAVDDERRRFVKEGIGRFHAALIAARPSQQFGQALQGGTFCPQISEHKQKENK